MDRRLVLRMLLQKSDDAQQFLKQKIASVKNNKQNYSNNNITNNAYNQTQVSTPQSPHIIFKRMQILQMGQCKIQPPKESLQQKNHRIQKNNHKFTSYSLTNQINNRSKSYTVSLQKRTSRQNNVQQRNSQINKFCQNQKVNYINQQQIQRPQTSNSNLMTKRTYSRNNQRTLNQQYLYNQKLRQKQKQKQRQIIKSRIKQRRQNKSQRQLENQKQFEIHNQKQYISIQLNQSIMNSQRFQFKSSAVFINLQKTKQNQTEISETIQNQKNKTHSQAQIKKNYRKKSFSQQTGIEINNYNSQNPMDSYTIGNNRNSASTFQRSRKLINSSPKTTLYLQKKDIQVKNDEQRKNKIMMRKQLHKNYAKAFIQPPKVTAQSYIITQIGRSDGFKIHFAYQSKNVVEIASLTKIMTCLIAIQFFEKNNLNILQQKVQIGSFEQNIGGTSAKIQKGQIYTLEQLLYGLMLPSGNDASLAIAVCVGRKLLALDLLQKQNFQAKQTHKIYDQIKVSDIPKKQCFQRFVLQMNSKAKQLGMNKTNYANSHGLVNNLNKSCAYDLAILCQYAISNKKFCQIVSTKHYSGKIQYKRYFSNDQIPKDKQKKSAKVHRSKKFNNRDDSQQSNSQYEDNQVQYQQQLSQTEDTKSSPLNSQKNIPEIILRDIKWQNSHRLLQQKPKQYLGIKTGVTKVAGPCLSSCVKSYDGRKFIIIVLNCKKMTWRFKQTQVLKKWLFKKQGLLNTRKTQKKQKTQAKQYSIMYNQEQQNKTIDLNGKTINEHNKFKFQFTDLQ